MHDIYQNNNCELSEFVICRPVNKTVCQTHHKTGYILQGFGILSACQMAMQFLFSVISLFSPYPYFH